jgi:hypothetical protein
VDTRARTLGLERKFEGQRLHRSRRSSRAGGPVGQLLLRYVGGYPLVLTGPEPYWGESHQRVLGDLCTGWDGGGGRPHTPERIPRPVAPTSDVPAGLNTLDLPGSKTMSPASISNLGQGIMRPVIRLHEHLGPIYLVFSGTLARCGHSRTRCFASRLMSWPPSWDVPRAQICRLPVPVC